MDNNGIPKIIHYCWFGKGKKNKLIEKCIQSWKETMPEYKIVEWNEDNFDINICRYIKDAYLQRKWAFVSDYVRLWVVYNYGGIYLDTDVELLKPISNDLIDVNSFFCLEDELINTGLGFGACKKNIIIKKLLEIYDDIEFDQMKTCVILNKPVFEECLGELDFNNITNKNGCIVFPAEYFCPLNYLTGELKITNNTIGIHWYGASWQNQSTKLKTFFKKKIKMIIGEKKYCVLKKIFCTKK